MGKVKTAEELAKQIAKLKWDDDVLYDEYIALVADLLRPHLASAVDVEGAAKELVDVADHECCPKEFASIIRKHLVTFLGRK